MLPWAGICASSRVWITTRYSKDSMRQPKVTIVTPSYQQAAYLEQTICSVLEQDYPDIEYMVIDGGSTDGSVEIIQRYADRLAYWVSERDSGQAEAINKGLRRATGDIVAWINSDDYYLSGCISRAAAALASDPSIGFVYADVLAVDGEDRPINRMRYGDWGLDGLLCFRMIGQPSVFMRRSVLEQAGLLRDDMGYLLDHDLWLRIAARAPVKYVPELWSAARYHAAAKNVSQTEKFCQEAYRVAAQLPSDPLLYEHYNRLRRQVLAGLYRLDGWYLSEGGKPRQSLLSYARSLLYDPRPVLRDWRRVGGTLLVALGMRWVRPLFERYRLARQKKNSSSNGHSAF
jgi:glycosyltransferase involved in cell wall biosynthesis